MNTTQLTPEQMQIAQKNVLKSPCFKFNLETQKIERVWTPERIPNPMERMMSKFPAIDHWNWHLLGVS